VHFPHAGIDQYVIMPNHIHGIIEIFNMPVGAKNFSPLQSGTSRTIGSIVRGFKIGVTKWCRLNLKIKTVWQRGYHDHIVRNDRDLARIREYIQNNPLQWEQDEEYRES
jgi:REP element-mobilizing transposase RayT